MMGISMQLLLVVCLLLLLSSLSAAASSSSGASESSFFSFESDNNNNINERQEPFPPPPPLVESLFSDAADANITRNFISATLGDNMVLQRDKPAIIWGYTTKPYVQIRATISRRDDDDDDDDGSNTTIIIAKLVTNADSDGLWRISCPPQQASLLPHQIDVFAAETNQKGSLENVLFGDVYICGGQSNMEFSMPGQINGTDIVEDATKNYQHIRLQTIGCYTRSTTPLPDLQKLEYQWNVPSSDSMYREGIFGRFSAVCYFFGKEISDKAYDNNPKLPIGLINNNWGGSAIESWLENGDMFNAMIYPYMVGPMALTGFTWYQGEANIKDPNKYSKDFPNMIQSWRKGFEAPDAYFGFIQLSTWCPGANNGVKVAQMRQAQMKAFDELPKIGYATNADHGAGCNIHPPEKRPCSHRLAQSALAIQYGQSNISWKSPTYAKAAPKLQQAAATDVVLRRRRRNDNSNNNNVTTMVTTTTTTPLPSVVIEFRDVSAKGLYILENPYNARVADLDCKKQPTGTCAWSQVLLNNGQGWVDAKVELLQDDSGNNNKVVMTPNVSSSSRTTRLVGSGGGTGGGFVVGDDSSTTTATTIVATSYGWGSIPMMSLYDKGTDLPVLPWNEKVV